MRVSLPGLSVCALCLLGSLLSLPSGCEHRAPVSQAEARANAESLQREQGLFWGSPLEVLAPDGADADGRRWWQLRYSDGSDGPANRRLILVDAASGWACQPAPGYRVRSQPLNRPGASTPPLTVTEGPYILLVTTPTAIESAQATSLEQEVSRLNGLAATNSLYPLFSLHRDDTGRTALVYGWQGDRGIQRDTLVSTWLASHTSYGSGTWVDLRR